MNGLQLYMKMISISIRSQMQHKLSFILLLFACFVGTSLDICAIWILFDRFKSLDGWKFPEVAVLYGIIHIGFAIAEILAKGFDNLSAILKSGDFDRILLRPRNTMLQIAGGEIQLMRVGRIIQALIVLLWGASELEIGWSLPYVLLILFAIIGGACLFCGLWIFQGTLTFWTTETLELMNTVTYGGVEAGQYPLFIYRPWFRNFFTFIIPLACVGYFPMLAITSEELAWFGWIAPSIGILFFAASLFSWKVGIRHYASTGS